MFEYTIWHFNTAFNQANTKFHTSPKKLYSLNNRWENFSNTHSITHCNSKEIFPRPTWLSFVRSPFQNNLQAKRETFNDTIHRKVIQRVMTIINSSPRTPIKRDCVENSVSTQQRILCDRSNNMLPTPSKTTPPTSYNIILSTQILWHKEVYRNIRHIWKLVASYCMTKFTIGLKIIRLNYTVGPLSLKFVTNRSFKLFCSHISPLTFQSLHHYPFS